MSDATQHRTIYLFHGKGGSPNGSVSLLERAMAPHLPGAVFERPQLLHSDPNVLAEDSLAALPKLSIPQGAIVVGISLGGLVAAALQEESRPDLTVFCISSPTWADGVYLIKNMPHRYALYSSLDDVIAGRTSEWPELALASDLRERLSHDTDKHIDLVYRLIVSFLRWEDRYRQSP